MNKPATVDEAIQRGHRMTTFPGIIIMIGTFVVCFYLGKEKIMPFWIVPVGFVLAIILAWLFWSIMITKWRIWAFENVRNVHELKQRAIQEKLIWADGNMFGKTEITTSKDKEKLKSINEKFTKDDIFYDDITVPKETIIFYSKSKNFLQMTLMLILLAGGIFLLLMTDKYILGSFISIVGAYLSYTEFKKATNTKPQIIISDKGIQTISTPFYKWKDIENEEAISEGYGKSIEHYLCYDHPGGSEKISIKDFDTELRALNKLLILYRGRSKS